MSKESFSIFRDNLCYLKKQVKGHQVLAEQYSEFKDLKNVENHLYHAQQAIHLYNNLLSLSESLGYKFPEMKILQGGSYA